MSVLSIQTTEQAKQIINQMGRMAAQQGEDEKTKAAYQKYASRYIDWCVRSNYAPGRESLIRWRDLLAEKFSPSTVNVHLSAVRAMLNELLIADQIDERTHKQMLQVKNISRKGQRVGNWLEPDDFKGLIDQQPRDTMRGLRDRAILALGAYCGLRREEIANLEIEHIRIIGGQPVIEIDGKGNKIRTVPVHKKAMSVLGEWVRAAGIKDGHVIRRINKGDNVQGEGMSVTAVWQNVKRMGEAAEIELAPHDLRRTCARNMHDGGADISGIQVFLGHSKPQTTQGYIGLQVDDATAAMKRMTL